mmetsp:Transcript_20573/g.53646  ORF Transcript_20573/g.53646 Transcript_20573/m.53646 type:complete len:239 (-) Transcript_20573:3957-4673(-)
MQAQQPFQPASPHKRCPPRSRASNALPPLPLVQPTPARHQPLSCAILLAPYGLPNPQNPTPKGHYMRPSTPQAMHPYPEYQTPAARVLRAPTLRMNGTSRSKSSAPPPPPRPPPQPQLQIHPRLELPPAPTPWMISHRTSSSSHSYLRRRPPPHSQPLLHSMRSTLSSSSSSSRRNNGGSRWSRQPQCKHRGQPGYWRHCAYHAWYRGRPSFCGHLDLVQPTGGWETSRMVQHEPGSK